MTAARVVLAALLLAAVAAAASATNWAVLIAGSRTYMNYRHQADVCHSYQILHAHGFPDSNIIVMMYDDIANNDENPDKGVLINQPNGPNVYKGVPKDYTGSQVNAKNFLAVLAGDSAAVAGVGSGRVLKSGPNDNVFVYFSDHGGPGLIAMPDPPYLYANDLMATLKKMYTGKKYKQLVFYLEACESGSMFDGLLPSNMNLFATTAANPDESSYACYYDDKLGTYLGDLYSVNWMQDSDKANMATETLAQQFNTTKAETTQSEVCEYGQISISSQTLNMYQAFSNQTVAHRVSAAERAALRKRANADAVDARDVVLETLRRRVESSTGAAREKALLRLEHETARREATGALFRRLVADVMGAEHVNKMMTTRQQSVDFTCMPRLVDTYEKFCGRMHDYALKHAFVFNNLCAAGMGERAAHMLEEACL